MKSHFVSLWFEIGRKNYFFSGRVIGKEVNGKIVVSPDKLFKKAFGFELPDYAHIKFI